MKTEDALKFVRETAESELRTIDRLHNRTIKQLSIIAGSFGVILALLGWAGFATLKQIVLTNTTRITKEQVQERLEKELTPEKIQSGVKAAITGKTEEQLKSAIRAEVAPSVREQMALQKPETEKLIKQQTTAIVNELAPKLANDAIGKRLTARSISAEEEAKLLNWLKGVYGPGQIEIHSIASPEAQNYAAQFARIFKEAGWKVSVGGIQQNSGHGTGLAFGVMDHRIDGDTKNAQAALSKIGLAPPIIDVQDREYVNDNFTGHAFLLVLPQMH